MAASCKTHALPAAARRRKITRRHVEHRPRVGVNAAPETAARVMPMPIQCSRREGRPDAADPCVLVVTPTLGASPFLDRTVRSVAALPVATRHLIAAPADRLADLQARFPGTRVVADSGRAGGVYGAINAALAVAAGLAGWDWFTYINDDDVLLPGCATALRRHLAAGAEEAVLYGDVTAVDEREQAISLVTIENDPAWIPALLQQGISPLMQQGMLMHRDLVARLRGFDTRYRLCADLDFWLRAYNAGAGLRYYPLEVARFRIHRGQLSGDTALTEWEQAAIVHRLLPAPISIARMQVARWRYRARNLPRYLARTRRRGIKTSYQLLRHEASRP
jgi:GT2 family glycosyltransferase